MENEEINNLVCEILPNDSKNYDMSFKIIVIGDSGVGKSCLTLRATKDIFNQDYQPTIGFEFCTFTTKIKKNDIEKIIKCQIWDTCGQEAYRSLIASFYKNASLAFIVYAINDKKSFQNIENWLNEVKYSNPDIKIFLVGTKVDLDNERQVNIEEAKEIVNEHKFNFFIETSAKTGFNTQNVFAYCAKVLFYEWFKYNNNSNKEDLNGFIVNDPTIPSPYKKLDNIEVRKSSRCCG